MSQDCWSSRTGQLETTSVRNCQRGREWWCNNINIHTHTDTCTDTYTHIHTHTCTYIYTQNVCLYAQIKCTIAVSLVVSCLLLIYSVIINFFSGMRISPMPCLCQTTPEEMANTTWLPASPASLSSLTWAQRCTMPMVRHNFFSCIVDWGRFVVNKLWNVCIHLTIQAYFMAKVVGHEVNDIILCGNVMFSMNIHDDLITHRLTSLLIS